MGRMKELLEEALAAGAIGLSTGLIYPPGAFAATEELIELCRVVAHHGGIYASHIRDEGSRLLEAVEEAIRIGREAGVPVQISHHKASGRDAWGLVRASLGMIDRARARGLDVTADQYPYTAGSTVLAAVVANADRFGGGGEVEVVIASAPGHPAWEGRSLAELGREWGVAPLEAAARVLDAEGIAATVIMHGMDEQDVQTVMRHPSTMIGSDGIPTLHGKPHPRLYGSFARVLGHYARDLGLLSMHEAVHRMTGFPARKFGLTDRGVVREGAAADLVLFDPARIADVASYADPHHPPAGIAHVFVNGSAVVRDGAHTGARPGRALRRGAARG
jgi:dihydroorotase/N-acyl-D-amino-acid deacylase